MLTKLAIPRRGFLLSSVGLAIAGISAHAKPKSTKLSDKFGPWRNYHVQYELNLEKCTVGEVWLPLPEDQPYQSNLELNWNGNFTEAAIVTDEKYHAQAFYARWEAESAPKLQVRLKGKNRDRQSIKKLISNEDRELYLAATAHMPLDGIVKKTALSISSPSAASDQKALAVYNWIVEKTFRDPEVKGCGLGDIASLLQSGKYGGKCADLNALFVGLCRALGVPAREAYGVRINDSQLFKSIGKAGDVSKAQHCRAEYYSDEKQSWVPVDAADVRKVILEEKLSLTSQEIKNLRAKLFGQWEMNWLQFNTARDFSLPKSSEPLNYFMYPRVVVDKEVKEGFSPDRAGYAIKSLG